MNRLGRALGHGYRRYSTGNNAFANTQEDFNWLPFKVMAFAGAGGAFAYYYAFDNRASIHRLLFMPLVRAFLDAEDSHHLTLFLAKNGLIPRDRVSDEPCLHTKLFGLELSNPVGMAAGFDKNGEAIDGIFSMGFGMVEIGSVTPEPQPGNPRPRLFRLEADGGAINRYGFNSVGHGQTEATLRSRFNAWLRSCGLPLHNRDTVKPKSLVNGHALGVNLGKNKISPEDSTEDYVKGVNSLGPYADYLVINVSSPNTPGLRSMQKKEVLKKLIADVKKARDELDFKPPLLVKIAPDLSDDELADIADISLSLNLEGIIISNTTIQRPKTLLSDEKIVGEKGGLSGKPLKPLSLLTLKKFYKLTEGKIPIIGCGGISSGEDAVEYIRSGASAIQIFTGIAYEGPGLVREIKDTLVDECKKAGVNNIQDLVGKGKSNHVTV